jgi:hypothetical protein
MQVEIKKAEPRDSGKMGDGPPGQWGPPQGGPPMGMGGVSIRIIVIMCCSCSWSC